MTNRTSVAVGVAGLLVLAGPTVSSDASPTASMYTTASAPAAVNFSDAPQWKKGKTYRAGAVVRYKSKTWKADRRNRNKAPKSSSKYWSRVSSGSGGVSSPPVGYGSVS